jgi:hypothetical protein
MSTPCAKPVQALSDAASNIRLSIASMHYAIRQLEGNHEFSLVRRSMRVNIDVLKGTIRDLGDVMAVSEYEHRESSDEINETS